MPGSHPSKEKENYLYKSNISRFSPKSYDSSAPPEVVDSNNAVINYDHVTAACIRHQQQAATSNNYVEENPAPISSARTS